MKAIWLRRLAAALVLGAMALSATAEAGKFGTGRRSTVPYSQSVGFYDPAWGNAPHSLVVPPRTRSHVEYQQGVGGAMWQRLPRGYPQEVLGGGPYSPMSAQPYSTNHMGVYYLRSPR